MKEGNLKQAVEVLQNQLDANVAERNRLRKEFAELYEENARLREQVDTLKHIAKRVKAWFSNEANYPEGSAGYNIAQEAASALSQPESAGVTA